MPNMDYPGPCMSCSAIDGCGSEEMRQANVKRYCKGMEMELDAWKAQLYDVLVSAEVMDTSDQAKIEDSLNLIKSTVKELELVVERMRAECPASISAEEKFIGKKLDDLRVHYTKALDVVSPGWLGG